jgi:acyl-CoA dehydrogenase
VIQDVETISQLCDAVRRFVRVRLQPLEQQVAETDALPADVVQEMRELGLFGLSIPQHYGGLGLSMEEECLVAIELGRTSPAFRSICGTNIGIGSQAIIQAGTQEQKSKWLPGLASGELISSFALTEPEVGSDAAAVRTTAKRLDGGGYLLNGTKRFITNAPQAHIFTVMARTGGPGASGVSAFLVSKDSEGLYVGKPDHKMGQQGTHTADVIFENCKVPEANLIGGIEGKGFAIAMGVLDKGRLHIAAVCCGMAERLIYEMVGYAKERKQFGKAIGEFQLIQAMLADSRTEASAARALVMDAARARDEGTGVIMPASCAKLFASEMVGRVADRAVQIFGGAGYMREYPIERFYRDARLFRIYEGTSQIQQLVIAREMLRAEY